MTDEGTTVNISKSNGFIAIRVYGKDQGGKQVMVTGTFSLKDILTALGQVIEYDNWAWVHEVGGARS